MTWWRNCTSSVDSTSPTSSSTPLLPSTSSTSSSSTSASSSPTSAAILDVSAAFYTVDHSGLSTARVRLAYLNHIPRLLAVYPMLSGNKSHVTCPTALL